MKKYLFFIISCLVVHNVSAKTIYVDNQLSADCTSGEYSIANRNSSGSDGNAYITIQNGVDNLNAGDCLLVREGLYKETAYLSKSGTVNKWITIKNYPGEMPHIDGERQRNAGLSGSTLHYIRIEGFYLTGHKYKGIDIGWEGICTHIEVRYIIGDDNAQSAVVLNNSDDSIIEYCIALRNGSWGDSWSSGINLFIPKGVNNIIRNNVSFQNVDISSHLTDGNGFIIDYGEAAGGGIFILLIIWPFTTEGEGL